MFKQFNDFFTIYALVMEDCMNDENKYDILVDYINGSFSCIIRNKETKEITYSKKIITSSLEANLAIDTIRNNFIFNHFINLPGINNNSDLNSIKVHNLMNTKFADGEDSEYYYIGYFSGAQKDKKDLVSNDFVEKTLNTLYNKDLISAFTSSTEKLSLGLSDDKVTTYIKFNDGQIAYDTIRIYLLTGFVFNNIQGFTLEVKAKTKNILCSNKNCYIKEYRSIHLG
jgi:hypothetical protein